MATSRRDQAKLDGVMFDLTEELYDKLYDKLNPLTPEDEDTIREGLGWWDLQDGWVDWLQTRANE